MSDKLNEKFEEFATEQKVTIVEGDPMPTVSANVIPCLLYTSDAADE